MNRSFSKIRHIQEANQRLEQRILNEQIQEQSTNHTIPKLGDTITIYDSNQPMINFTGKVYKIFNNYSFYLKKIDGTECAKYTWDLKPEAKVEKKSYMFKVYDPEYGNNLKKISCNSK